MFRANGVEDRVTLLQGWSSTLSLPEPATVFVSEIVGHDPLDEGVLEHTLDARTRLLAPGARLVPRALRVRAYGMRLSARRRGRLHPERLHAADWRSWYGIDLGPLGQRAGDLPFVTTVRPEHAADWEVGRDPVDLLSVDLATFDELAVESGSRPRPPARAARSTACWSSSSSSSTMNATVSTGPPGPSSPGRRGATSCG